LTFLQHVKVLKVRKLRPKPESFGRFGSARASASRVMSVCQGIAFGVAGPSGRSPGCRMDCQSVCLARPVSTDLPGQLTIDLVRLDGQAVRPAFFCKFFSPMKPRVQEYESQTHTCPYSCDILADTLGDTLAILLKTFFLRGTYVVERSLFRFAPSTHAHRPVRSLYSATFSVTGPNVDSGTRFVQEEFFCTANVAEFVRIQSGAGTLPINLNSGESSYQTIDSPPVFSAPRLLLASVSPSPHPGVSASFDKVLLGPHRWCFSFCGGTGSQGFAALGPGLS
jgi:hypothetical protein